MSRLSPSGAKSVFDVFVISDQPLVCEGVRRCIEGLDVLRYAGDASSVAEALDVDVPHGADVFVLDQYAPTHGLQLIADVERLASRGFVAVLAREADGRVASQALRAGARAIVSKRSCAGRVVDAIKTVACGGTFLDDGIAEQMLSQDDKLCDLTSREVEVLKQMALGLPSKTIAKTLGISVRTIESHRHNIRRKLAVEGQAAMIKYAVEQALPL
jgi:DNA-binding NarL/FixJ family response regulator